MTPLSPASLPELLYLHDPLCGWCYGLSPAIRQLQTDFAGRLDVSVLCGGMVVGPDAGPIADTWDYIRQALAEVEKVTGVRFGDGFRALDAAEFARRWAAPETAQAARQEFAAVARIGVQGFPTAVVRVGEQGYVLARSYQPHEQLRAGPEPTVGRS